MSNYLVVLVLEICLDSKFPVRVEISKKSVYHE